MANNFIPLLFVDHIDLAGSLRRHEGLYDQGTPRILQVREPRKGTGPDEGDFVWCQTVREKKWVQMTNFLGRLKREAEAILGPIDLGWVFLEMLDPGAAIAMPAMTGSYFERHTRVVMALRTNPATLMVSGVETASPAPGWVTAVNERGPGYMANMGQHPRVHLVVDFKKKEPTDG